jgi:hypothetical protein
MKLIKNQHTLHRAQVESAMDIDIFSCASVYPAYLSVRMRREGGFEGPCRVQKLGRRVYAGLESSQQTCTILGHNCTIKSDLGTA